MLDQKMQAARQRHFDTVLPMALATLLIVNSHLEAFYPRSWMAADGLLGNYMFFLLSGVRMAGSRGINDGVAQFLKTRILRFYPVVWVAALVVWICISYPSTLIQTIHVFVWPTDFTYVELIIPFYVVYYWLHRARGKFSILQACVALAVFWAMVVIFIRTPMKAFSDVPAIVHVADYLLVFLLGVVFQTETRARLVSSAFSFLMLSLLIYFCVKLAVFKMAWLNLYWLVHVLGIVAACLSFLFLAKLDWRSLHWRLRTALDFLASHSLEIYVIHSTLIRTTSLHQVIFPANVLLLFSITIMLAWVLRKGMVQATQLFSRIR